MFRHTLVLIILLKFLISNAQTLEIKNFTPVPMDLSASTESRQDFNGNYCALVKVVLPNANLKFQGAIVGEVKQYPPEYWVYMPSGSKYLVISEAQSYPLKIDFSDYGIHGLETKRIYELILKRHSGGVATNSINESLSPEIKSFDVKGIKFKLVKVNGGTFKMGATSKQIAEFGKNNLKEHFPHLDTKYHYGCSNGSIEQVVGNDEKPVHQVVLDDYYIGITEVTQELWQVVMGKNPSKEKGASLPVTNVSWDECKRFLKKLNKITGVQFRLPTEAEWEFAARGGIHSENYIFSGGDNLEEISWCYGNSKRRPHSVALKKSNELGIYDMTGNVREWCSDWYDTFYYRNSPERNPQGASSGEYKVVRGGDYEWNYPSDLFTFSRGPKFPSWSDNRTGFRLALN